MKNGSDVAGEWTTRVQIILKGTHLSGERRNQLWGYYAAVRIFIGRLWLTLYLPCVPVEFLSSLLYLLSLMGLTIAVTGASGHIGNVVCRRLLDQGHRVRAMYHTDQKGMIDLAMERIKGNILQIGDVLKLIEGCDIVIHCAGIITISGDPDGRVYRTNTEGPQNVLDAALSAGVRRIIHVSSVHAVTELPHALPYDESRPYKTGQDTAYDYSKAMGEQILLQGAKNTSLEVVILRPSSVIGPYDFKPSIMGSALKDFYFQKIPFLPPGGYDFVDVRDVARAVVSAIEKGRNGEAYVLSGKYYNFKQLTGLIQAVTGKKVPRRVIPYWYLRGLLPFVSLYSKWTGRMPAFTRESIDVVRHGHPRMDHSKARRELDFVPRSLEDSLRDFYMWQRDNHMI